MRKLESTRKAEFNCLTGIIRITKVVTIFEGLNLTNIDSILSMPTEELENITFTLLGENTPLTL